MEVALSIKVCMVLVLVMSLGGVWGGTTEEWKSRTIYQLLTDRFATTDLSTSPCPDFSTYCGGTYQGAVKKLDYISNMGFDAIWISPIVANTPNGYHGYWAQNIYETNPYFGSGDDLHYFIEQAHARDIWVMLDVVGNHMGPVDIDELYPFNQSSDYHACVSECDKYCSIENYQCFQTEIYDCKLAGLPDLNQTQSSVRSRLLSWIAEVVREYDFDGLRIDTVPEVDPQFWKEFVDAAGVYAVGETFTGDVSCVGEYTQVMGGCLSYPVFFSLRNAFLYGDDGQSLKQLNYTLQQYATTMRDPYAMGTFIDNHDNARWLSLNAEYIYYKSALAWVVMGQGIPIVYYGTEQGYAGGNDPNNREPLWTSKYNEQWSLYEYLQTIVQFRKEWKVWDFPYTQRALEDNLLIWTRGPVLVAVTNRKNNIEYQLYDHPYKEGETLCNIFFSTDCVTIQDGAMPIYLNNGEVKMFQPVA